MTSSTFFFIFIPILSFLLLLINLLLAPHNPYQEKDSVFECGFHSFLGQNRTQFNVSFFIFGLLFLLFDLEILLVYPYSVSGYTNEIYGLSIVLIFFVALTLGFIFELGKNALSIDSKQTTFNFKNVAKIFNFFYLSSGYYLFLIFYYYYPKYLPVFKYLLECFKGLLWNYFFCTLIPLIPQIIISSLLCYNLGTYIFIIPIFAMMECPYVFTSFVYKTFTHFYGQWKYDKKNLL